MVTRKDIQIYSTHNQRKSVVAERLMNLKNKIYKYVITVSKCVYC